VAASHTLALPAGGARPVDPVSRQRPRHRVLAPHSVPRRRGCLHDRREFPLAPRALPCDRPCIVVSTPFKAPPFLNTNTHARTRTHTHTDTDTDTHTHTHIRPLSRLPPSLHLSLSLSSAIAPPPIPNSFPLEYAHTRFRGECGPNPQGGAGGFAPSCLSRIAQEGSRHLV
jgi:hypothetical protein